MVQVVAECVPISAFKGGNQKVARLSVAPCPWSQKNLLIVSELSSDLDLAILKILDCAQAIYLTGSRNDKRYVRTAYAFFFLQRRNASDIS